jgi:hypothetical protein
MEGEVLADVELLLLHLVLLHPHLFLLHQHSCTACI